MKENNGLTKTICPSDGICNLIVLEKKEIHFKNENTINFYPEIVDSESIVLTFEYKRNEIPNTVDGSYSELIYLELDPDNLDLTLEDKALQDVKLLFARFCYCKGQTGYYKINNGTLKIEKINTETYYMSLSFSQDKVPQIINFIGETFELKKSL